MHHCRLHPICQCRQIRELVFLLTLDFLTLPVPHILVHYPGKTIMRTSIFKTSAAVQLTNRQRKGQLKLKSNSCHSRYTTIDRQGRGGTKCEVATSLNINQFKYLES